MAQPENQPREILILPPGQSKHFYPHEPKTNYIVLEGNAEMQEWRQSDGKIRQGAIFPIPTGEFFPTGGGIEIVVFNIDNVPLKYRALRTFSALPTVE